MPPSFDGTRFQNPVPTPRRGLTDLLRWRWNRSPGPWREWTEAAAGPAPPERAGCPTGPGPVTDEGEESCAPRLTFVNHSTVLIQIAGLNILTDPIWSERASPVSWAGPRRVRPPGIDFDELPPIDLVLISHNHYDHLDLPTLKRLQDRDHPHLIVGLGNGRLLSQHRLGPVTELRWWGSVSVRRGARVHAVPAQHFSQRGLGDRNLTLWTGFVVEAPGGPIYFAGDTGAGPHFAAIGARFKPRLAILPIGAFRPRWFMSAMHLSPWEAVLAHRELKAERSLAVHFGTFRLADDGQDEPPRLLRQALRERGLPETAFWVLGFGEGRTLPEP